MSRHAPPLLPQQALMAAAILAAAGRAAFGARELEAEVGRDRNRRFDADRSLESAAERNRHAVERQRRDLEALELEPSADGPGCETDADQRKQEADGRDAVSAGDLVGNDEQQRQRDEIPDHGEADGDVGGTAYRARDAAVCPFGAPTPRLVGILFLQRVLRREPLAADARAEQ